MRTRRSQSDRIAASIRLKWTELGIGPARPATESELEAFCTQHSIQMADDLRWYFSEVCGMEGRTWDEDCLFVASLSHISPIGFTRKWCEEPMFALGDWMTALTLFGFSGRNTSTTNTPIFRVLGDEDSGLVDPLADSIEEFLKMYLETPESLTLA